MWPGRPSHDSTLLRVGVADPPRSPSTLVRSYRTVSPLPVPRSPEAIGGLLSVALYRQVAPPWLSPAPLPCGAPTFLDVAKPRPVHLPDSPSPPASHAPRPPPPLPPPRPPPTPLHLPTPRPHTSHRTPHPSESQ